MTLEAGVAMRFIASAKTVDGAPGELNVPVESTNVRATEAIFMAAAGPKFMEVTENVLLVVQVGHS